MKKSNIPMRKCIGCLESKPQNELVRIACYEGGLTVDPDGRARGRGVYVCRKRECIDAARKKRAVVRGFKGAVTAAAADEIIDTVLQMMEGDIDG